MAQFINAKETLVVDSIDGLLRSSGGNNLARLDGYPAIKVVLRTDHKPDKKVAIIAGGGSGHEPAHAGFVGPGLLTAAVCGEVFSSPSVDAVFAARGNGHLRFQRWIGHVARRRRGRLRERL